MNLCIATSSEKAAKRSGDELIAKPRMVTSHAISIASACKEVWPWIAQIGQSRGGFYSYSFLENLIGCRIRNADRIHDEWQNVKAGDEIAIHPRAQKLKVISVERDQHLVLFQKTPVHWSWSFYLEPQGVESRLIVRTRVHWRSRAAGLIIRPVMTTGHYIMERRMLIGVKQRAEAQAG